MGFVPARALPGLVMALVILSWGAGPPITKLITAPPQIGVVIRFGMSVPLLFGLLAARGLRLDKQILKRTAAPGIAFGINLIFVFAALQEASVATLSSVVSLQPAVMLLLAGPLFGERPTIRHVLLTIGGIIGTTVVILGAGNEVKASGLGILFAVAAMATFSVYFVLTRVARSSTDVGPIEWMTGVNLWSFIAAVPPALLMSDRAAWSEFGGMDWVWITVVAYITGVLGHVLMSWVHAYIEAARSSLYILAMHLVAVGLAWPIHNEPITIVQVIGGAIVLASVAALIRTPPASRPT